MRVQVETVKADEFSMDYCRFGNGTAVLVVLPGLSVQSVMPLAEAIAVQYQALTDDFTIYVFDRRKGMLPETYSVHDMAEDTAEAVRKLGLRSVSIFGASQGGMMAMEIAAEHPELVDKIIIGSSSACVSTECFKKLEDWIVLAKTGKAEELYISFGELLYPEDVFEGAKEALSEAAKNVTEEDLARFIIMTEAMRGFDISDKLERITCPALVIGSKTDRVLGDEASVRIAGGLKNSPDCELYMYDGYGHAVYDCAPDYQERMLNFLKRQITR